MPQTTEGLRNLMLRWFGPSAEWQLAPEDRVEDFLKSHGYTITKNWYIVKPTPAHTISVDEWFCIRYLVEEWDYGLFEDPSNRIPIYPELIND